MLSGKPRRRTRAPRHLGCGLQHNRHYQTPGFYLNSLLISPLRLRYRRASLRTTGFGVSRTLFPRDTFLQEFWSPPEFLAKCRVFSLLNLLNQSDKNTICKDLRLNLFAIFRGEGESTIEEKK